MLHSTILLVLLINVPLGFTQKVQEGTQLSAREKSIARYSASVLGWLPESAIRRIKPIPPSAVCKNESDNGRNYFDRCNWCHCADIGEAYCTRKACPIRPAVLPRIRPLPAAVMCTKENAGKSYNDGCNMCICPTGKASEYAACTRRACPPVLPFKDIVVSTTEATCRDHSNGTVFYETECKLCICTGLETSWCYDQERPGCQRPVMNKFQERARARVLSGRTRSRDDKGDAPTAIPRVTERTACLSSSDKGRTYFDGCNWCQCIGVHRSLCTWRSCKRKHRN
ncbi:uncharacterized protein LOC135483039 [Lineus longissimus]|uniref:uncharacterized protein LOC135483039 n=1 Tax=Lineus longissimus TaxID=88925 RepID=UPI00315DF8A4